MKENFDITGYFYEIDDKRYRKYLNIQHKKSNVTEPDLMVIMMNPGSSEPEDQIYNKETRTKPDNTQSQIMTLMEQCGFTYARILNLSDVCEPKSRCFYQTLKTLDEKGIPHSIFHDDRSYDLEKLYKHNTTVIYAWGVSRNLKILAELCIEKTNTIKPLGIKKGNHHLAYWHPMQRFKHNREKWIEDIVQQVKYSPLLLPQRR